MMCTVSMGSCVQVQGVFVRAKRDGNVIVRVGSREFEGRPVRPAVHYREKERIAE